MATLSPRPVPSIPGRFARLRFITLLAVLSSALSSAAFAQTPTPSPPPFSIYLTTSRGCFETGQNPVYGVGELIKVSFRMGSSAVTKANATLFDVTPGRVRVLSFGELSTNVIYAFAARIAPPTGIEQLVLRASAVGARTTQRSCSFAVVDAPPPGETFTPTATRTPTMTRTPRNTATPTSTPDGTLSGSIRTSRGCHENGDAAVFGIGERVDVLFRVNSASHSQAQVSIADILAGGAVRVFSFGTLPTNTGFLFRATVAPPLGVEKLQLRARAGGPTTPLGDCSFLVVGTRPATATRTAVTRTPTRTRAVTRTRTGTPTPTATPTP